MEHASPPAASLQAMGVSKTYTGASLVVRAVQNVSINLRPGEFVALVGPSGSGKTTLLAMLAGLLSPTDGRILIDGHDLAAMKDGDRVAFRRRRIGFTFQTNNLVPYLTARENVELMLRLNGRLDRAGRKRAEEVLVRLGLGERLNNLPGQLSGGQQQRVAIARALIHDPAVVLADEPTASLDTERAYQVVETFAGLIHEQNRAGIMVTHDLRMCQHTDRIIHMQDGQVVAVTEQKDEIKRLAEQAAATQPATGRPVEPVLLKRQAAAGAGPSQNRDGEEARLQATRSLSAATG